MNKIFLVLMGLITLDAYAGHLVNDADQKLVVDCFGDRTTTFGTKIYLQIFERPTGSHYFVAFEEQCKHGICSEDYRKNGELTRIENQSDGMPRFYTIDPDIDDIKSCCHFGHYDYLDRSPNSPWMSFEYSYFSGYPLEGECKIDPSLLQ